jgi:antitoxin ParD1/3/4
MANVEKISIALPSDMLAMVRDAVETGDYASSSEVVREALRQWKARRALQGDAISELKRLWQEGLDSGAGKPLNIEATKGRARQRLKDKSST